MAYSYDFTARDRENSQYTMFKSLEFKGSRKRSVWMSVAFHGVLLSTVLLIPLIFTDSIHIKYGMMLLAPPPPPPKPILEVTNYRLPPPPKPKPEPKPDKPIVVPPPEKPRVIEPPKPKLPDPPKIAEVKPPEIEKPIPNPPKPEPAPVPKPEVHTGSFSTPNTTKPTTNLPAAQVQTGGFGDPNGIKGEGKPGKVANIASLGSFDLPAGPGAGNGSGGARGTKGVVTSSGFSDTAASATPSASASNRGVRTGGFGDAEAARSDTTKKRAEAGPPQTPVEILFKPKPEYTDEARKLKLEGEVSLRILFTASGEVRVLDVVQGLGHGLDQSATKAAQQIKFKPALRDGQPIDSTATVRIVFQLAY